LPIVSSTGKTFKINLIINTATAYFQFKKINVIAMPQSNQPNNPTQAGNIGSSGGRVPLRLACISLISNVVIDEVIAYRTVRGIIIDELIGVLNSVII